MQRRTFLASALGVTVAVALAGRRAPAQDALPTPTEAAMVPRYQWKNATKAAAFAPRDGAGLLSFKDQLWLLGGWNPSDKKHFPKVCNSEVWSSADGRDWHLEVLQAPWEG